MPTLTPAAAAALPRLREAVQRLEQTSTEGAVGFHLHKKSITDLMHAISLDAALVGNYDGEPDTVMALNILIGWSQRAMFPRDLQTPMDLFVSQIHDLLDAHAE